MIPLTSPAQHRAASGTPLWRLGFRPFFLFGALFTALAMLAWMASLHGHALPWQPVGGWLAWHRHEMVFGFVMAIVGGFLLTAVPNWTGIPSARGRSLMMLAVVWLLARLLWLLGADLRIAAMAQMAFMLGLAGFIASNIYRARQPRNYPVVAIVGLLGAANLLALVGVLQGDPSLQTRGAMAAILLLMTLTGLIAARVIPMFTKNGLRIAPLRAVKPAYAYSLLLGGALAGVLAAFQGTQRADGMLAWAATALYLALGIGHLWQLAGWYHRGIWRVPLLWSLHLAYAWMGAFALGMAAWQWGWLDRPDLPLHALTVGGLGGMTLGMMARVSLGHTGRPLQPPRAMHTAFMLLNLGALLRVVAIPSWWQVVVPLAGLCWAIAFLIFAAAYAKMLMQPRVDGMPG
ncbi:NnrS family protein [Pigmentiphaga aceris]|uniref:NnrS family protein n=1 Tax=Pigmentiphaga aceris TaxID=1940612 RepID=A0A5C0B310_9BURK|nr:NnrS family protein [Pigmentiphaga aceris]QEI07141.1 NnrS family protein [Pigmentiphaga aceris]